MKNDRQPAFPESHPACPSPSSGLTKREWFAGMAPAEEIADICPNDAQGCAALLGISVEKYKGARDYLDVLSKLRFMWADAILAEAGKLNEKGAPDA